MTEHETRVEWTVVRVSLRTGKRKVQSFHFEESQAHDEAERLNEKDGPYWYEVDAPE